MENTDKSERPTKNEAVTPRWAYACLLAIAIAFSVISLSAASTKSITNDEIVHITSGYYYLKTFDFRLNTEHPPLVKEISAIPLLMLAPEYSETDTSFRNNKEWDLASKFFFRYNKNADQMLFFARLPMILIALIGLWYTFLWAKELYGHKAALFAAALYAMNPTILAHAPLVTPDVAFMAFGIATLYHYRKFLAEKTYRNLAWTAGMFGLTMASKYTAIYLLPVLGLLAIGYELIVRHNKRVYRLLSFWQQLIWIGVILAIALAITSLTYGIIESPKFVVGLGKVIYHGQIGHRAFLLGEHSETGWPHYFAVAMAVKEPIALLLILAAGICCTAWMIRQKKTDTLQEMMLIIPAIAFFTLFSAGKIDIGIRHILLIYPLLMICASKLVNIGEGRKWISGLLLALLLWNAAETAYAYPDYIPYFNQLGGDGYNILMDSNIDWGQDLKPLAAWLASKGNPKVDMAYFGNDDREYRNITWEELKCGPRSGFIAISANFLNGFTKEESTCSGWLKSHTPIAKIGGSIFIYNISEEEIIYPRIEYCKERCVNRCESQKLLYLESSYNESCRCRCA